MTRISDNSATADVRDVIYSDEDSSTPDSVESSVVNSDPVRIAITTYKSQIGVIAALSGASDAQHGGKFPLFVRIVNDRSLYLDLKVSE